MHSPDVLVDAVSAVSMAADRRVHRNGVSQNSHADIAFEVVGQRLSRNPQGGIVAAISWSSGATCSSGRLSHHDTSSPCLLKKSFREY